MEFIDNFEPQIISDFYINIPYDHITAAEWNTRWALICKSANKSQSDLGGILNFIFSSEFINDVILPEIDYLDATTLQAALTEISDRVHTSEGRLDTHDTQIEDIETVQTALQDTMNDLGLKSIDHEERLTVVEENLEELNPRMEDVEIALDTKVDKITGKGLSTQDFTNDDREKLDTIERYANYYALPPAQPLDLGGVKAVLKTTETAPVAIDEDGFLWAQSAPASNVAWGAIIGDINNQTDLMAKFASIQSTLSTMDDELTDHGNDLRSLNNKATSLDQRVTELEEKDPARVNSLMGIKVFSVITTTSGLQEHQLVHNFSLDNPDNFFARVTEKSGTEWFEVGAIVRGLDEDTAVLQGNFTSGTEFRIWFAGGNITDVGGHPGNMLTEIYDPNKTGSVLSAMNAYNAELLNDKEESQLSVASAINATNAVNATTAANALLLGGRAESALNVATSNSMPVIAPVAITISNNVDVFASSVWSVGNVGFYQFECAAKTLANSIHDAYTLAQLPNGFRPKYGSKHMADCWTAGLGKTASYLELNTSGQFIYRMILGVSGTSVWHIISTGNFELA